MRFEPCTYGLIREWERRNGDGDDDDDTVCHCDEFCTCRVRPLPVHEGSEGLLGDEVNHRAGSDSQRQSDQRV